MQKNFGLFCARTYTIVYLFPSSYLNNCYLCINLSHLRNMATESKYCFFLSFFMICDACENFLRQYFQVYFVVTCLEISLMVIKQLMHEITTIGERIFRSGQESFLRDSKQRMHEITTTKENIFRDGQRPFSEASCTSVSGKWSLILCQFHLSDSTNGLLMVSRWVQTRELCACTTSLYHQTTVTPLVLQTCLTPR